MGLAGLPFTTIGWSVTIRPSSALLTKIAERHVDGAIVHVHACHVVPDEFVRIRDAGSGIVGRKPAPFLSIFLDGAFKFRGQAERLGDLGTDRVILISRMAIPASMPMIATTIINSIKVNPE